MTTTELGRIRNVSADNRIDLLGGDRLVLKNATVLVPLDQVTAYTQSETIWAPADDAAQAVHDEMLEAIAYLEAVAAAAETPTDEDVEALLAALLADASAKDIAQRVRDMPAAEAQVVLELEQRGKGRSTITDAAEKRIADLTPSEPDPGLDEDPDPDDPADGLGADDTQEG